MSEARDAERLAAFEDRRMWRLLLARLHPDAGGDHDLFVFACAIRDGVSSASSVAKDAGEVDGARSQKGLVTPFLRAWQETMDDWSSGNRDALRNLWIRQGFARGEPFCKPSTISLQQEQEAEG